MNTDDLIHPTHLDAATAVSIAFCAAVVLLLACALRAGVLAWMAPH